MGAQWTNTVIFSILILVLVFRPAGIFGNATTESLIQKKGAEIMAVLQSRLEPRLISKRIVGKATIAQKVLIGAGLVALAPSSIRHWASA